MTNEENIAKLQKLLEAGVITQQEFDIKKAELTSEPTEEELSELNDLLEKDLISKDEYEALKVKKKKDAVAAATAPKTSPPAENTASVAEAVAPESFIKKNLVFIIIIAVLATGLIFTGSQFIAKEAQINKLQDELVKKSNQTTSYHEKADKYKSILEYYYIDTAVIVSDGDNKYYHRFNCPDIPDGPSMWLKYSKDAESNGYKKCPKCIESDVESFIDNYF